MIIKGKKNKISDVKGVRVGHVTIDEGIVQTGISLIFPSFENPFINKLQAASYVINGFGKTTGLVQIDELGQLESPIALTNTLSVGRVQDALVGKMIELSKADGVNIRSINTVVAECNDSMINDITTRTINENHLRLAFDNACEDFELGAVGAGRGMVCYEYKGGIGSSSRIVNFADHKYTVGTLVLANHGKRNQLRIYGNTVYENYKEIESENSNDICLEQGSIVVIIATDAPLDARQLSRMCKRATAGIARTGSEFGNGSGDVVIAFSTVNKIKHSDKLSLDKSKNMKLQNFVFLRDDVLDIFFSAAVQSVEESIYSALINAESVRGVKSLLEVYPKLVDLMK